MKQLFFAARTTVSKNYDTKIERKLQFRARIQVFFIKTWDIILCIAFLEFQTHCYSTGGLIQCQLLAPLQSLSRLGGRGWGVN
jgi:hypothetical protein